ncbi:MAG: adenylosuccinate synthase [Bradymonadia bacterium]|jgi:adenylosuccinate synthase
MPGTVVIGAQWGDEGKGKIVDLLTRDSDLVIRFQGGNNAGHTLVVDSGNGPETTVLHLIPSGILYKDKTCIIGSGVTIDVDVLFEELEGLAKAGKSVDAARLRISRDAHVTMPYHTAIDKAREARRSGDKIGTTGRGIGPSYEDRAARRGIRVRDLLSEERLRRALLHVMDEKNALISWLGGEPFELDALVSECLKNGDRIRSYVDDTVGLAHAALDSGKEVLFEGAQGTLLDVGHGTYPFVTSSYTTTGGVTMGAGVPPQAIDVAIGVAKAYVTRVGSGPFPTELDDADGQRMRDIGHEYGATTGRPRRCGWFDVPVMRQSQRLNGLTGLALTKLDVLSGFESLKICVAYDTPNGRLEVADLDAGALEESSPIYEEVPGWAEDITEAKSLDDLPDTARAYLDRLSELCGVPIAMVSVGPARSATIVL